MPRRATPETIALWGAAGLIAAALLLAFVLPGDVLLTAKGTDTISEFVAWRAYLADSLRSGHIPLWNPYTYGGQPFLGGFESAVLYPPNWLFVVMPLGPALNFSFLLHLILLGWGMQRWAASRGLSPWAAGLAGLIVPLSGAVFPHVYAGHLSNICTMAWAPWIFLGLERGARGDLRGYFLASAGICLQILAGHVQYVFYTAIAAGLHAIVLVAAGAKTPGHGWGLRRWRPLLGVAGVYVAAAFLGAAQLLPSFAASVDSIRQQKLDYTFAAMFGFSPENFLTLIAPGFFGSIDTPLYWGRCYFWEMSLFMGAASLLLLALALAVPARRRQGWLDMAVALPLLVLALGVHTPLFDLLYNYAPGFGHFRSWSKFIFPATLFLVMVIASGADAVLRGEKGGRRVGWAGIIAGAVCALAGLGLYFSPESITPFLQFELNLQPPETYMPKELFTQPDFVSSNGWHAGLSLLLGGTVLAAAGALLLGPRQHAFFRWGIPALVALEMIGYIAGQFTVSHLSDAAPPSLKQFEAQHPGDYRVLLPINWANNGFLLGKDDMWGNNPTVLRRYAEFMTFTQNQDPNHATQYVAFQHLSPLFALVRFQYGLFQEGPRMKIVQGPVPPLPHVLLVPEAKVISDRDEIFAQLSDPVFDPQKTVVLESEPSPAPQAGATGSAKVISETPGELTIQADTDKPSILLVTDLYAHGWRAEALPGSVQSSYQIMPGDYILRAIPLQAGHHALRLVYAPAAWPAGVAVSAVAWLLWLGVFFLWTRPQPAPPAEAAPETKAPPEAKAKAKKRR
ncbi:MAG TPA: hypothetical protein VHY09_08290 [Candidatus Methylacidiphilales bacterium]|nr:hypothetical protein [Candidatus Methylacidiphilales bacterium]